MNQPDVVLELLSLACCTCFYFDYFFISPSSFPFAKRSPDRTTWEHVNEFVSARFVFPLLRRSFHLRLSSPTISADKLEHSPPSTVSSFRRWMALDVQNTSSPKEIEPIDQCNIVADCKLQFATADAFFLLPSSASVEREEREGKIVP